MTACTVRLADLSAYVDGELSPEDELTVRRHLDVCSACAATIESLLAVKNAVAGSAELRPVPHTLRERVTLLPRGQRPGRPIRRMHLGILAAGLVLSIAVVADRRLPFSRPAEQPDHVSEALVADHIHFLNEPSPFEVASNDGDRVATALGAKTGFPVTVPRLDGAALLGGRLCSLWGQKVALTFYEAGGKRLSLFVADRTRFPSPVPRGRRCTAPIGDYGVCLVPAGDRVFAMVGERAQTAATFAALEKALGQNRGGAE
jgi:anti-sigma factor RsiW